MNFSPMLSLSLREVSNAAQVRWKIKIKIRVKVILAGLHAGEPPLSEIFHLAELLPPNKIEALEKLLQSGSNNEDHWMSELVD